MGQAGRRPPQAAATTRGAATAAPTDAPPFRDALITSLLLFSAGGAIGALLFMVIAAQCLFARQRPAG